MASLLYEVLERDIRKMVRGLSEHERGNIYPLLISQVEKYLIELVLEETKNNYFHAARSLGISRNTLYRKIETLCIEKK
ncbi:MAG: helix-turn-helix domain-containing protein [Candidatus Dependentiae bacterium]|jgi:DNA-binding protein Fis